MVHALKMGWMKPSKPDEDKDEDEENQNIFFNIWNEDEEVTQIEEWRQICCNYTCNYKVVATVFRWTFYFTLRIEFWHKNIFWNPNLYMYLLIPWARHLLLMALYWLGVTGFPRSGQKVVFFQGKRKVREFWNWSGKNDFLWQKSGIFCMMKGHRSYNYSTCFWFSGVWLYI